MFVIYFLIKVEITLLNNVNLTDCFTSTSNYAAWHKNSTIYKIIVDLGIRHVTRCEKYTKWSGTISESVGVLLILEYHSPGKGS